MQDKMICPADCPMLNKVGFCESAWRRSDAVAECPHRAIHKAVFKLDTRHK